ncbi:MAG: GDP-mannose 4,6-dehydratase [Planctomycetaceae bacterium]|nr:GDP-mannose 4,6-dehydratase [Planctomycetaceae bacterium]
MRKTGRVSGKVRPATSEAPLQSRPLRIVSILGRMNVGGPAQLVAWMTAGLNDLGHDAHLVTGTVPAGEVDMLDAAYTAGVEPIVIPELSRELTPKDTIVVWKLYRELCRLEPDVVHTHTAKAGAVGRLAAWLYRWGHWRTVIGIPRTCHVIHTFHGHIFHSYFGPLKTRLFIGIERFLGRWMTDRIIVLSQQQLEEIHHLFRVGRADQFDVIPVAVDVESLTNVRQTPQRTEFRQELGATDETFVVGIIGRLVPIKNHSLFLRGINEYCRHSSPSAEKAKFVVIGDGELREELSTEVERLALTGQVVFLGNRRDPEIFYAGLDAVVLTSENEGTPMSLLEAMASRVPVISTLVGGVPDLLGVMVEPSEGSIEIRERGIGIPSGDATSLAQAIHRLQIDSKLRQEITQRSYGFVQAEHTRQALMRRTVAVFDQLTQTKTTFPQHAQNSTTSRPVDDTDSQSLRQKASPHIRKKDPKTMRVLITGGAGFVGSHLADAYLERGDEVVVIDDLSTGSRENVAHLLDSPRFQLHVADVRNEKLLDEVMADCDAVFHLAAAVGVRLVVESPVRTIETNIQGTEAVLKVAARHNTRILITSTSEVYGLSTKVPFKEDDNLVMGSSTIGRWSYACSKAIDEFLALAYYNEKQLPAIVVRLFNTVGPRQTSRYGMVIPTFIRQALTGEPITVHGDGRQTRCFSFVTDVVAALVALMDHPDSPGQVFNIGSNEEISIAELAEIIKVKTDSESDILVVPYSEAYRSGFEDMQRRVPDVSKLEKHVGFRPMSSLEQILDGVIASIREDLQHNPTQDAPQGSNIHATNRSA